MSRPREFDRDVVLERAMNVFWEHGYEAASMRDLLAAMEIGRQSVYDTFGDKHGLFLASLQHYCELGRRLVVARLSEPDGGLEAIEEYFDRMARDMSTKPFRSCFVINSAIEWAPHDPEVAAIVNRFIKNLQKGFAAALEVAARRGEATPDDVDAVAWHLANSAMGLGPMSKARVPHKTLKLVSEQVLKSIQA